MGFWDVVDKVNWILESVQDFFDVSPMMLRLSQDAILRERIKQLLSKYALYDAVNTRDSVFNGFGLFEIEFVGKENEINNFMIVLNKMVFEYLRSYYLGFVRTKVEEMKIGENVYILRIYYCFSKKTLRNYDLYFNEIMSYKKQEVLEMEIVQDDDLEKEMDIWNV